jgi:hypothetical protein
MSRFRRRIPCFLINQFIDLSIYYIANLGPCPTKSRLNTPPVMHPYLTPYRLATYLLLIFCTAHTFGGLLFPSSNGPAGDAVLASMKSVHFTFNGADCTYYGFHLGFGLMASVFLLFSAALTWHLSRFPGGNPVLRPVAWALFLAHVPTMVLSWQYFFAGPGISSTVIALLLGWECLTTYA